MDEPDPHALGYRRVDDDRHVPVLLDTMDATGAWAATVRLRSWERRHLRLGPGQRLLDVGCGLGDAGLALAVDLGPGGALVGIDASEAMAAALAHERNRPSNVGRRLAELVRAAGCQVVAEEIATERWTSWDPDATPVPAGCFSMRSLAGDLVGRCGVVAVTPT